MGNNNLQKIRLDTLAARDQRIDKYIPQLKSILEQSKLTLADLKAIIDLDLVGVVNALNSHQVTSLQLIAIYGLRAATLGRQFRAITQDYFEYAINAATICDNQRKRSGKRNWIMSDQDNKEGFLPPLYGVPITIKDNIEMANTRSTVGLTMRAEKIIKEDSPLVKCLKNSGMIPFVKTNIPQLGFTYQTNNLLWGRCLNPWNRQKTTGGSSGGEAVFLATKMSVIGVGNDYGGSVRIPAQFCGVCALLPSTNRIMINEAITKYSLAFNGKDFIKNMNGPLARSIDSLALWVHITTTESYYEGFHDPYIKLIPFDFKLYKQIENIKAKLKIGFIQNFELVECSPACLRALRETVAFLKEQGHQLVPIKIPNQTEVIFTMFAESIGEGGLLSFKDMLEGEPLAPQYKMMNIMGNITGLSFHILKFIVKILRPRIGRVMEASKKLTTHEYFQKIGRGYELRTQWVDYWRANKLDFVLCPGFGSEALNHGVYDKNTLLAAYTFVWNILAMTVCSLPITVVREDEQFYESRWRDEFTKAVQESTISSKGLPVGIQVVGLPFQQQKVLGISKKIESYFKFQKRHPYPDIGNIYDLKRNS